MTILKFFAAANKALFQEKATSKLGVFLSCNPNAIGMVTLTFMCQEWLSKGATRGADKVIENTIDNCRRSHAEIAVSTNESIGNLSANQLQSFIALKQELKNYSGIIADLRLTKTSQPEKIIGRLHDLSEQMSEFDLSHFVGRTKLKNSKTALTFQSSRNVIKAIDAFQGQYKNYKWPEVLQWLSSVNQFSSVYLSIRVFS